MTRTNWPLGGRLSRLDPRTSGTGEGSPTSAFPIALGFGALAAVLLALGAFVPVVAGATPGFISAPLLIVLALAPMVLVVVFLARGRSAAAVGVLAGTAALAPGRLVTDLEFLADPSASARPELYRPEVFALPGPAAGLWLLLAGLVATAAAGGFALRAVGARSDGQAGRGVLLTGLLGAMIAAVGVMMAPFSSEDAFVPVGSAFESPGLVLAGSLLMAFGLPVAAALSITSGTEFARGGLLGLGVGAATLALPNLVSGLAVPALGLTAGPIVMLVGTAGLVAVAFVRKRDASEASADQGSDESGEASLPGSSRLRVTAGVLGLLTMLTALVGALLPSVMIGDLPGPHSPARWLLFAAGLLVGVLGITMFMPPLTESVRPALSVSWSGVALAATAVLTNSITASELGAGLGPGPAVPWIAVSVVLAGATACCSVVAGMVERDDREESDELVSPPALLIPLLAGGVLAIGAYGMPTIVSPDYTEPALWSNFGTPSWGLLIALCTVLGVTSLALRSRPARASALLAGAAGVTLLRLLTLPLASGQIPGARAGLGWWLTLICGVALAISAVTAVTATAVRRSKK
ncbi:hypothetical protein [Amycolatopsis taiwanensis]|uniref:hypothetical protein n=1 Tax=Amycolatopsis taiwanensis TaxID=342230 RepID=UPI00255283DF|nr:hypothetical protein [Amycolatopsis taiwanensis]